MQEVLSVVLGLIAFLLLGLCWSLVKAQDLLEDENDELNNVVVDCLKELDKQDSDIKDLNDKIGVLAVRLDNLGEEKAKVEAHLREHRASVKTKQDSIEYLRSFITIIIDERDNLARELDSVKKETSVQLEYLDSELQDRADRIYKLEEEIEELKQINDTLTLTLARFER